MGQCPTSLQNYLFINIRKLFLFCVNICDIQQFFLLHSYIFCKNNHLWYNFCSNIFQKMKFLHKDKNLTTLNQSLNSPKRCNNNISCCILEAMPPKKRHESEEKEILVKYRPQLTTVCQYGFINCNKYIITSPSCCELCWQEHIIFPLLTFFQFA